MPLETPDQVTAAIRAIVEGAHPNGMKQLQRHIRAATLADLFEIRASLWRQLGTAARTKKSIPDAYADACAVAEKHDRDQAAFWRREASAR